jgi:hypothetical protein
MFDFAGRAKWDTWKRIGSEVDDADEARARYVELARRLGWTEGKGDGASPPKRSGGGGGGMVNVSTLRATSDADAG